MNPYGGRLVNAGRITLTIDGIETDRFVCGFVDVSPAGATLEGYAQVMMNGEAYDVDLLDLSKDDVERIEQLLCDTALADAVAEYCDLDPDEYDNARSSCA